MPAGNVGRCLQELGYAVVATKGTSMWPLLREGTSSVQLVPADGAPLQAGEVVLYRRSDGQLILHRIIHVESDGTYLLCGDHQWQPDERLPGDRILAVAQGFTRSGRYFDGHTWWYRLYQLVWNRNLTLRRYCLAFLRLSGIEKRCLQPHSPGNGQKS